MRRRSRPACIFGRRPLLRFGCFCRRQRLSCAALRPFRCVPLPLWGWLFLIYDLNPPGCGALFLRRATAGACKKQTAAPAPPRLNLPQAAARLRSPPPFIGSPAAAPPPPYGGSVPGTASLSGRPAETVRQAGQVRLLCSLQIEGIVRGPEPLSRGAAAGRGLPLWAGGWVQMFPTIERQSVRYRLCREALRFQESDRAEA